MSRLNSKVSLVLSVWLRSNNLLHLGIDSFGGSADLSDVSVAGSGGKGGNEYIVAPLKAALQNPSNFSLSTIDVTLPVVFQGVKIGRAAIAVHSSLSAAIRYLTPCTLFLPRISISSRGETTFQRNFTTYQTTQTIRLHRFPILSFME